ncbi:hypothetical protein GFY24_25025 [Nocardia sp. SYP-A9097]|uniref:hypothetical protein n=1 Tax=Nocardia sp. SYP-A9097 TaxID=2663237 RepID=UPI00129B2645|nr:hypothetical protein [Nocardia sp. SYP-A9097]MRH90664.1 hypothetical protein [Nocardia sp. SYP-A9097]
MSMNGVAGVRATLIAGLLVVVAFGAGCSTVPSESAPSAVVTPSFAPKPAVAPAASITAAPGEVRVEPGPFTDRIQLTGTRLDGSTVRGRVAITTDVSDVLALEVRAAFYDAAGRLVGTGHFEHADEETMGGGTHIPHNDGIDFTITSAPTDAPVSAAVLSIPVLVNE